MQTTECYVALKREEILKQVTACMIFEDFMLSELS